MASLTISASTRPIPLHQRGLRQLVRPVTQLLFFKCGCAVIGRSGTPPSCVFVEQPRPGRQLVYKGLGCNVEIAPAMAQPIACSNRRRLDPFRVDSLARQPPGSGKNVLVRPLSSRGSTTVHPPLRLEFPKGFTHFSHHTEQPRVWVPSGDGSPKVQWGA